MNIDQLLNAPTTPSRGAQPAATQTTGTIAASSQPSVMPGSMGTAAVSPPSQVPGAVGQLGMSGAVRRRPRVAENLPPLREVFFGESTGNELETPAPPYYFHKGVMSVPLRSVDGLDATSPGRSGVRQLPEDDLSKWANVDDFTSALNAGRGINQKDKDGNTLLHYAARGCNIEAARMLTTLGADLDVEDSSNITALGHAASNGDIEMVKHLVGKGAQATIGAWTPLQRAITSMHTDVAKFLIEQSALSRECGGARGGESLLLAAASNQVEIVNLLLDAGVRPDEHIIKNDHSAMYGLPPIAQTTLACVSSIGHVDVVKALLKAGADVNFRPGKYHALFFAAESQSREIVDILIEAGAKAEAPDLFKACTGGGNIDIVKALLRAGADPNRAVATNNRSAWSVALASGSTTTQLVEALLEGGASIDQLLSVNHPGGWKCPPVYYAALCSSSREVVELLLNRGANTVDYLPILLKEDRGRLGSYTADKLHIVLNAAVPAYIAAVRASPAGTNPTLLEKNETLVDLMCTDPETIAPKLLHVQGGRHVGVSQSDLEWFLGAINDPTLIGRVKTTLRAIDTAMRSKLFEPAKPAIAFPGLVSVVSGSTAANQSSVRRRSSAPSLRTFVNTAIFTNERRWQDINAQCQSEFQADKRVQAFFRSVYNAAVCLLIQAHGHDPRLPNRPQASPSDGVAAAAAVVKTIGLSQIPVAGGAAGSALKGVISKYYQRTLNNELKQLAMVMDFPWTMNQTHELAHTFARALTMLLDGNLAQGKFSDKSRARRIGAHIWQYLDGSRGATPEETEDLHRATTMARDIFLLMGKDTSGGKVETRLESAIKAFCEDNNVPFRKDKVDAAISLWGAPNVPGVAPATKNKAADAIVKNMSKTEAEIAALKAENKSIAAAHSELARKYSELERQVQDLARQVASFGKLMSTQPAP